MNKFNRWLSMLMIAIFSLQSTLAVGSTTSLDAKQSLTSFLKDPKLLDQAIEQFQALRGEIDDEAYKKSFMIQAYSKKMGMHPRSFENYPSFLAWVDAYKIYNLINDESYAYTFRSVTHRAAPLLIKKGQVYPTQSDPQWGKIIAGGIVRPDGSMPDNWIFTAKGFETVSPKDKDTESETGTCAALDLLLDECKAHTIQEVMEALQGQPMSGLNSEPDDLDSLTSTDLDDPALVDYAAMWPSIYNGKGGEDDDRCSSYFEVFGENESFQVWRCHEPTSDELIKLMREKKTRSTLLGVDVEDWAQINFPSIYPGTVGFGSLSDHKECTAEFYNNCGTHKTNSVGPNCRAPIKEQAFDVYMMVRFDASSLGSTLEPCPACRLTTEETSEDVSATGGTDQGEHVDQSNDGNTVVEPANVVESNDGNPVVDTASVGQSNDDSTVVDPASVGQSNDGNPVVDTASVGQGNDGNPVVDTASVGQGNDDNPVVDPATVVESNDGNPVVDTASVGQGNDDNPVVDPATVVENNEPEADPASDGKSWWFWNGDGYKNLPTTGSPNQVSGSQDNLPLWKPFDDAGFTNAYNISNPLVRNNTITFNNNLKTNPEVDQESVGQSNDDSIVVDQESVGESNDDSTVVDTASEGKEENGWFPWLFGDGDSYRNLPIDGFINAYNISNPITNTTNSNNSNLKTNPKVDLATIAQDNNGNPVADPATIVESNDDSTVVDTASVGQGNDDSTVVDQESDGQGNDGKTVVEPANIVESNDDSTVVDQESVGQGNHLAVEKTGVLNELESTFNDGLKWLLSKKQPVTPTADNKEDATPPPG